MNSVEKKKRIRDIKKNFGEQMRQFKKQARVMLIDDNYDHLAGVKELLSMESSFDIVAASTSANVGINLIKKHKPDVVLMDMNMPEMDGLQAIQEIEKLNLDVRVLALSAYDDADLIFRAMKLGAKGYVLKTMASAQLIYAIDEVANGKVYMPPMLTARFFDYFQKSFKEEAIAQQKAQESNYLSDLTQREEEVLDLLTQGVTYKGVAQQLFISETTVKTHVNNIFQKLQVNDRTQAVLYAINHGFTSKRQARMANPAMTATV